MKIDTETYIGAIKEAKKNKKKMAIHFGQLSPDVDKNAIRDEITSRIPEEYKIKIDDAYIYGKGTRLDFGVIPVQPTIMERVSEAVTKISEVGKEKITEVGEALPSAAKVGIEEAVKTPFKLMEPLEKPAIVTAQFIEEMDNDILEMQKNIKAKIREIAPVEEEGEAVFGLERDPNFKPIGVSRIALRTLAETLPETLQMVLPTTFTEALEFGVTLPFAQLGFTALIKRFPWLAKEIIIPKQFKNRMWGELNGVLYRVKKGIGLPQETGIVPVDIKKSLYEGKLDLATALRNSEDLYKEHLLKRMLPQEMQKGAESILETPSMQPPPAPKAVMPSEITPKEIIKEVKIEPPKPPVPLPEVKEIKPKTAKIPEGKKPKEITYKIDEPSNVVKSITKKMTIPILQNVKVEKGKLYSTDLDVGFVKNTSLKDGMYRVVGKDIVPVSVDIDEFPVIPINEIGIGKINRNEFIKELERAMSAKSYDEARHVLNGILLDVEKGIGKIVSTDGKMLSISKINLPDFRDGKYLISSPEKLISALKGIDAIDFNVKTTISDKADIPINSLTFEGKDGLVMVKLMEGSFPNYQQVFPNPERQLVLDSKQVKDALKQLRPFAKQDKQFTVKIDIEKDSINMTAGKETPKSIKIPSSYASVKYEPLTEGTLLMPLKTETPSETSLMLNSNFFEDSIGNVRGDKVFIGIDPHGPLHIFGKDLSIPPTKEIPKPKKPRAKTSSPEKFQALKAPGSIEEPGQLASKNSINKLQILDFVEKAFDIPIRGKATARMRFEEGHFEKKTNLIRLKRWGELEVLAHEIGHSVDKKIAKSTEMWVLKDVPKELRTKVIEELENLDYDQTKKRISEGFAEYFRYKITTEKAVEKAPTFDRYFNLFLDKNPHLRDNINKFKQLYSLWLSQGAEQRILNHIDFKGEFDRKFNIKDTYENAKDWVIEKWFDELWQIRKLEAVLKEKTLTDLPPTLSPYKMARYFQKTAGAIARTFAEKASVDEWGNILGPSLKNILDPIDPKDIKKFIAYGVSNRIVNVLEPRSLESGFDLADAHYIFKKYNNPPWQKAVNEITQWGDNLLDWLVRAGGLGEAEKNLIRQLNPVWLPFKRIFIDETNLSRGTGSILRQGKPIKVFKGSGRPIVNPIESLIESAREIILRAQKIRIGGLLADFADKPGMGGYIAKLPPPIEARKFTLETMKKQLVEAGIDIEGADLDKVMTIFSASPYYKGKDNIISIWRKGERKFFEIHPDLYKALLSIDPIRLGPIENIAGVFARIQRLGATTFKASFGLIKNPFRDALDYTVGSKRNGATIFDPIQGIYREITAKEGELPWKFKAMGGDLGTQMGYDRAVLMNVYDNLLVKDKTFKDKTLKVIKHPIDALRQILQITEMGPRIAELEANIAKYKKTRPDWTDEDAWVQSFLDAEDVTVDFRRSGTYSKKLNHLTAFHNAAMQGISRTARLFRDNPTGTSIKGLAYLTPFALYYWYQNRQKQWYKNLQPSYKYNNIFFDIGNNVYRLPIPHEIGLIFQALPVAIADSDYNNDPKYYDGLIKIIESQIPSIVPTIFHPVIDVMRNKDFLGRPIESEGMKHLPVTDRKRNHTSQMATAMSKGFNSVGIKLSPIQLDYMIWNYTGGLPNQFKFWGINEPSDYPIIGDITLRNPEKPYRQLEEFFREKEGLTQRNNTGELSANEKTRLLFLNNMHNRLLKPTLSLIRKMEETGNYEAIKTRYQLLQKQMEAQGFK